MQNRFEKKFGRLAFQFLTNPIYSTKPISCARSAECDIYSMVGRSDLQAYFLAIKSILRFTQDFSVTILDDGTLTQKDHAQLRSHIPNHRLITLDMADARASQELGESSFLYAQRRVYLSWRRLIDMQNFRRSQKIINLDTDVLCINEPIALIEWMRADAVPFVLGQCNGPTTPEKINGILPPGRIGSGGKIPDASDIQSLFLYHLPELCKRMQRSIRYLDGGCAGVHGFTHELCLTDVEALLKLCNELHIPMNKWGAEQSTVLFLLSTKNAQRLPTETNFNFFPDQLHRLKNAELVHFIGLHRYDRQTYAKAGRLIAKNMT